MRERGRCDRCRNAPAQAKTRIVVLKPNAIVGPLLRVTASQMRNGCVGNERGGRWQETCLADDVRRVSTARPRDSADGASGHCKQKASECVRLYWRSYHWQSGGFKGMSYTRRWMHRCMTLASRTLLSDLVVRAYTSRYGRIMTSRRRRCHDVK